MRCQEFELTPVLRGKSQWEGEVDKEQEHY